MKLGKAETCAHCGKQFKALLDKHDEQDCIDHLTRERDEARREVEVLRSCNRGVSADLEAAEADLARAHAYHEQNLKEWQHKCSALREENARLKEKLTLDVDYWKAHAEGQRAAVEKLTRERDEAREDAKTLREGWDREEKLRRDRDAANADKLEAIERERDEAREKLAETNANADQMEEVLRAKVVELLAAAGPRGGAGGAA